MLQAAVENTDALTVQEGSNFLVHSENIVFEEESLPLVESLPATIDETRIMDKDATAALGEYLTRPVKIHSFTWNESDAFSTSPILIHPWSLYFSNAYIKRKLENFARINCKLKLTFRFNASPFYYGLMRAAYDPMNTNRLAPISVHDMIPISQAPGVWIEPNKSTSVELELPFLWPHNWLNIGNNAEFTNMGKLMFTLFSPLRSANGVTGTGITVSTYAEAVDVTVAGLTLTPALQAGVVSGPATAIADIAGALKKAPVIGKFARAVEVGSRAVSSIASMFGFSNPPNVKDVNAVQPKAFHAFANTETSMPIDKLCVDPHNETTIDNSVAGGDSKDELGINYLVSKTSYLTQVDWQGSDAPGTKLLTYQVCPGAIQTVETGPANYVRNKFMTPMAWVGNMFRQWHGGIEIHIKVVKSKYHKGRLLVCWDPSQVPTSGAETALFTQVLDLSSDQDEFSMVIPYKCTFPWSRFSLTSTATATRGDVVYDPSIANGVVAIFVQNVLTAPAASPVVDILLSVNAAPDMQYSIPITNPLHSTTLQCQAKVEVDNQTHQLSDKLNLITVGESIVSLRPLLHRATYSMSQLIGANRTADSTYVGPGPLFHNFNLFPRLPPEYGFSDYGLSWAGKVIAGSGAAPFNFSTTHPINYILMAFVGYRGSTNVHANVIAGGETGSAICSFAASRSHDSYIHSPTTQFRNGHTVTTPMSASSSISRMFNTTTGTRRRHETGQGGMSLTNGNTQSALSVNIPMYSPWKFMPAWGPYRDFVPQNSDRSSGVPYFDAVRYDTTFFLPGEVDVNTSWPLLELFYSAGVDFQPVYFVGVPRSYDYDNPNAVNTFNP